MEVARSRSDGITWARVGGDGRTRIGKHADAKHDRLERHDRLGADASGQPRDREPDHLHAELNEADQRHRALDAPFGDDVQQAVPGRRYEGGRAAHRDGVDQHGLEVQRIQGQHDPQSHARQHREALRQNCDPAAAEGVCHAAAKQHQQHDGNEHRHLRNPDHLRRLVQHHGHQPREHDALHAVGGEPGARGQAIVMYGAHRLRVSRRASVPGDSRA